MHGCGATQLISLETNSREQIQAGEMLGEMLRTIVEQGFVHAKYCIMRTRFLRLYFLRVRALCAFAGLIILTSDVGTLLRIVSRVKAEGFSQQVLVLELRVGCNMLLMLSGRRRRQ